MAKILLFKNVPITEIFSTEREISRTLSVTPFWSIMKYYNSGNLWATALNVLGNVVIFVPFGVYLMLYSKRNTTAKAVVTVFITSLSVEVVQFVLDIGILDVDDITLNVLGGLIGVWTYKILKIIFKEDKQVKQVLNILSLLLILIYFGIILYAMSKGIRIKLL